MLQAEAAEEGESHARESPVDCYKEAGIEGYTSMYGKTRRDETVDRYKEAGMGGTMGFKWG